MAPYKHIKTSVREFTGMLLVVFGPAVVGFLLFQIITHGLRSLAPLEATLFADGLAAAAVGAWMLLVPPQKP